MTSINKLLFHKVRNMNIPPVWKMFLFGIYEERKSLAQSKYKSGQEAEKKEDAERIDYDELASLVDEWFDNPANLKYDFSVDELASNLAVSKKHLLNYFQTVLIKDFRTYKIEKKIEKAKEILLDEPYVQIIKVAERLGFNDRSNFHRQFKRLAGCTPCQWRNSCGHPELK